MTINFARYNDGSANPPRLRIQHSLWSLRKLPMNSETEWTLAEKFQRVKAAGFEAVECWLTDEDEQEHKNALNAEGLPACPRTPPVYIGRCEENRCAGGSAECGLCVCAAC